MFNEWEEFRANYRKCFEENETLKRNRLFSKNDHCLILGIHHRMIFEMEYLSSEFLVRKNNQKNYRKYELLVY